MPWLLCASPPAGDPAGLLRLDLGWRWYIALDAALSEPYRAAFTELLEAIEGMVPDAGEMPQGCHFHPRCQYATDRCRREHPPLTTLPDGRQVRCFRGEDRD